MFQFGFRKSTSLALLTVAALQWSGFGIELSRAQHIAPAATHTGKPKDLSSARYWQDDVKSGLDAYDNQPLGERTPLVLVHGIGGTASRLFHWENFLTYADRQAEFKERYKIYLYHYDSTRSVPAISEDLKQTLKDFIGALGGRPIKILAYSEGGLLARNALQDKYVDDHTLEILAIATPFHGSPLANPEWMQQQAKTEFSLMRVGQQVAYRVTGRKYPTFREDFGWDNFDGAIPAAQYQKSNRIPKPLDYALAKKQNFITYGSYFGLDVDSSPLARELGLAKAPPKEKMQFANLFKKNVLFSMVRKNIGKLPLADKLVHSRDVEISVKGNLAVTEMPATATVAGGASFMSPPPVHITEVGDGSIELTAASESIRVADANVTLPSSVTEPVPMKVSKPAPESLPVVEPVSMMMYNDGISPISSTLWLGRYTKSVNVQSVSVKKLWTTLKSLQGKGNTRLFAGLDHRNWMDGATRTGDASVQDLLNPQEQPRTVFEWIIYDLMS